MRTLVTGGTGFIGRALITYLLENTKNDLVLLRHELESGQPLPAPLSYFHEQIDIVYADLRNFRLTLRAVQTAESVAVIHLAAAGATDPFLPLESALRHNITGTLNLLRACFENQSPIQQLIVARTPGELTAMNVYAASKAAAWNFCQMYARTQGWPIHGAMIFQAYGPNQPPNTLIPAAILAAQAGQDFPMTTGNQERDWIYSDDIAAGLNALLGSPLQPGATVELGTGTLTTVADVVQLIYSLVGKKGRPLIGVLSDRPGEDPSQVADTEASKKLIGWESAVTLEDGLKKLVSQ